MVKDGSILNFYERIPKKFLKNAVNPNVHLHNLKIPFRMCVVAPSGSGKTNFLLNLIKLFCDGQGTFEDITIITRNKDEPLYNWLSEQSEQIIIKEGLHSTPELDKMDKEQNHLVVWDDLVLSKDLTMVENYYIRARKLNCSVIFLSQSYFKIPKNIRGNCSYLVLLKLSGQRETNLILSEFGLGITKEELIKVYEFATKEKLSPLLIDMEAEKDKRFRKGFNEYIDINNIGSHTETKDDEVKGEGLKEVYEVVKPVLKHIGRQIMDKLKKTPAFHEDKVDPVAHIRNKYHQQNDHTDKAAEEYYKYQARENARQSKLKHQSPSKAELDRIAYIAAMDARDDEILYGGSVKPKRKYVKKIK